MKCLNYLLNVKKLGAELERRNYQVADIFAFASKTASHIREKLRKVQIGKRLKEIIKSKRSEETGD